MSEESNKIFRSSTDKMLAGICGGLGKMLSVDPTIVRLGAVLITLLTGVLPVVIVYLVGWVIIPESSEE